MVHFQSGMTIIPIILNGKILCVHTVNIEPINRADFCIQGL